MYLKRASCPDNSDTLVLCPNCKEHSEVVFSSYDELGEWVNCSYCDEPLSLDVKISFTIKKVNVGEDYGDS